MVEHSVHTRSVICSSQIAATIRPVGQAVKTPPFHGGNMGSIPVRVTKTKTIIHWMIVFVFVVLYTEQKPSGSNASIFSSKMSAVPARQLLLCKRICAASRRRYSRRSIPYGSHHSGGYRALENSLAADTSSVSLKADTFSSRRRLGGMACNDSRDGCVQRNWGACSGHVITDPAANTEYHKQQP